MEARDRRPGLGRRRERPGAQPDVRRGRPAGHRRQGDRRGPRLARGCADQRPLRLLRRRRDVQGPARPAGLRPGEGPGPRVDRVLGRRQDALRHGPGRLDLQLGSGPDDPGRHLLVEPRRGRPFNQIASPGKLQSSGSAQNPGKIGREYKPGVQAWYNQFLVVDPANPKHLYAGLEEVYETTDGGSNWVTAAPYWNLTLSCFDLARADYGGCPNTTHSDQHAATVANGTLWVGNDGGVFSRPTSKSTAGGGWTDHNSRLGTLQYYYADSGRDPMSGRTVFWGGLQDNGTSKLISGSDPFHPLEASQPFGGDGGDTIVDHANADQVMTEYTSLSPAVSTNGGAEWTDATPGDPSP